MRRTPAPVESVAVLGFLALFAVFGAIITDSWFQNLPTLMRDMSWLGLIAIGQAMVIIAGEFDLSVGSVFGFAGLLFVMLLQQGLGAPAAFALAMAAALGIGALNGAISWFLGLPSLLVTLGFLFVYRGLVQFFTGGFPVTVPEAVRGTGLVDLLGGATGRLENAVFLCAGVLLIATLVLTRTRFGAHLVGVGGDLGSARACGVLAGRVKVATFMISAGLAGLAGIIAACKLSAVTATSGEGLEFEAVAAAVIGGCSLRGGIGSAWGAMVGVATLMSLKAGLILMGINIFVYQLLLGSVLVGLIAMRGLFPRLQEAR